MFSIGTSERPSRLALRVLMVAVVVLAGATVVANRARAASVEVGYRDFAYGSSATAPTGMKPESKLWYTQDNIWWGSMFNKSTGKFEIYKFDRTQQSWATTGVAIDARRVSQADALYHAGSGKLYIVSHPKEGARTDQLGGDFAMMFRRYTYTPGTAGAPGRYTLDSGFPVTIAALNSDGKTPLSPEGAVLDRDSKGMFWVTWTEPNSAGGRTVRVTHSTTSAGVWAAPYDLPVAHANNLGPDEMSTLVAYKGMIGVLWGNEHDGTLNFAAHKDGMADTAWALRVLCDASTFGNLKCPDDHLNIKSLNADGTGRVFAIVKTSLNDLRSPKAADPLEIVWKYEPSTDQWTRSTVWTVGDDVTRAITLLDTSGQQIYAFAAAPCCSGGTIYYKKSSYNSLSFAGGLGTPFIRSSLDPKINNITSTKQSVNAASGLLVLGGDDSTRYYLHNFLPLG
jgi:hypothetical protein